MAGFAALIILAVFAFAVGYLAAIRVMSSREE